MRPMHGTMALPKRGSRRPSVVRVVAVVIVATMVAGAGVVVALAVDQTPSTPARVVLTTEDFVFSERQIEVSGEAVAVTVANVDAVTHTFTIARLGVDLTVAGGEARSLTFDVKPGRYTFVCTVPGHDGAGMRGELVVR